MNMNTNIYFAAVSGTWNLFALTTQSFGTCSKLLYSPADLTCMRRTLFQWIGMDWNDQEWPTEQTRMVDSSLFGSWFGTVELGHKQEVMDWNCYFSWVCKKYTIGVRSPSALMQSSNKENKCRIVCSLSASSWIHVCKPSPWEGRNKIKIELLSEVYDILRTHVKYEFLI